MWLMSTQRDCSFVDQLQRAAGFLYGLDCAGEEENSCGKMSKRLSSGGGIAEEGLTGDDVLAEEDDDGKMSGEHGQKVSGIGLSWLEVD